MTQYKAVPMGRIVTSLHAKPAEALGSVAELIGAEAVGGWKFLNLYHMPVDMEPGCFQSLMGKKGETVWMYMLIFVKEEA